MIKPTIHMNGTAGEDLANRYSEAAAAVNRALGAHMLSVPNGRDYYPQGESAFRMAMDAHEARRRKLLEVQEELVALADHVHEELDKRRR